MICILLQAELKRMYTQLRMHKLMNIYQDNPHIATKKKAKCKPVMVVAKAATGRRQSPVASSALQQSPGKVVHLNAATR